MTRKMLYEEQAAENVVYCSLPGSSGEHPRLFYDEQTPAEPSPIVNDERAVIDLWQKSAEWVGLEAQR